MSNRIIRLVASDFNNALRRHHMAPLFRHRIEPFGIRPLMDLEKIFKNSLFRNEQFLEKTFAELRNNAEDHRTMPVIKDGKWEFKLDFETSQIKPEDIDIKLEDGFLKISGKSTISQTFATGSSVSSTHNWTEKVKLPKDLEYGSLKANFDDNLLTLSATIEIPKPVEKAEPIEIPISK
jgi:HSP20 family molecular chaperone IbpA